ncbi:uncharacterized protein METZ01_LOCUS172227 [marine metagenome]|uniref:Glycosyltransferase 2-like domain-containing protein n=1 Tax=marine metagenome TaxID=408172 RepID=A0A382C232_9ZZZZ
MSIIIPAYNEQDTIREILSKVEKVSLANVEKEIIIVNDSSTDKTPEILKTINKKNIKIYHHKKNKGKGAAIQTGLKYVAGDAIIIQDADLEYDPEEYPKLLAPIINGNADVVYGSRFKGGEAQRVLFFWHSLGNKILTALSNMFTNLNLTDMECGYKIFRNEIITQIKLRENRFGFEPEITAKIGKQAKKGKCRIYEVGISYFGRTYEEGKKITWKDGFSAFKCIIKYNLFY